MTGSANDWADELTLGLVPQNASTPGFGFNKAIATALRAAELRGRAMGMREAAKEADKAAEATISRSIEAHAISLDIANIIRTAANKLTGEEG